MSSAYVIGVLDPKKVVQILYGLSYNKTLAEKSKTSVDQIDAVYGYPSSISHGDNFAMATFNRWVKEEMDRQMKGFAAAAKKDTFNLLDFIKEKTLERNKYYQGNITAQQNIGRQNKEMADFYTICMRTTASIQYAAEMSLMTLGAFASAPTTLVILGKRVIVGIGTGLAISIAENWSQAKNADMLVMPSNAEIDSNIRANIPSISKDFNDVCSVLNDLSFGEIEKSVALADRQLRAANQQLRATTDARVRFNIESEMQKIKMQRAKDLSMLSQLKEAANVPKPTYAKGSSDFKIESPKINNAGLTTTAKSLNIGLNVVCWALVVKSTYDSTTKFAKHWQGEL